MQLLLSQSIQLSLVPHLLQMFYSDAVQYISWPTNVNMFAFNNAHRMMASLVALVALLVVQHCRNIPSSDQEALVACQVQAACLYNTVLH